MKKIKILYYNWVQFDNEKNIGGGINVYQKNLIKSLDKNEYDIYFLSSGQKYNPFKNKIYIKQTENIFSDKCKSFEIINSPIISPAFHIYMNPQLYTSDSKSVKIFDEFIEKYGPFDIIHFNSLEGISVNVFKLKEKYPDTKFIFSVHNYQLICPAVQYFNNNDKCICRDFNNGKNCLDCQNIPSKKEFVKKCQNYLKTNIKFKILAKILSIFFMYRAKYYMGTKQSMRAENYVEYRKHNIEIINQYADKVLAVSERVGQILIENGINPKIVKTSYIGTKIADIEQSMETQNKIKSHKTSALTICYMGYKRHDKGYYFLIDALSKLPKPKKINLVLAVKGLNKVKLKLNNVTVYNGYKHDELKTILQEVDLGIVPVLWEDNLPQVAIEMVAHGVPILCSSFGGASELCKSDLFKFNGGDEKDFIEKLTNFINNPELLKEYWPNHPPLVTMEQHVKDLKQYYKS